MLIKPQNFDLLRFDITDNRKLKNYVGALVYMEEWRFSSTNFQLSTG
jgi:hypothetical protein